MSDRIFALLSDEQLCTLNDALSALEHDQLERGDTADARRILALWQLVADEQSARDKSQ